MMRIWSLLVVTAVCLAVAGNVWAADEKKEKKAKKKPCPIELFKKLDKDSNGTLSLEEMSVRAKDDEAKKRAAARFKRIDKDEDGKISQKEFSAAMAKHAHGKKGKKPCDKDDKGKKPCDKDDKGKKPCDKDKDKK